MSESPAAASDPTGCERVARRRTRVLHAIADSVEILAAAALPLDVVPQVLAALGDAFDVERIVVIEALEHASTIVPRFQWTAPGIKPIDPSFFTRVHNDNPEIRAWLAPLAHGNPVIVTGK